MKTMSMQLFILIFILSFSFSSISQPPSVETLLNFRKMNLEGLETNLISNGWKLTEASAPKIGTPGSSSVTFAFNDRGFKAKYWLYYNDYEGITSNLILELYSAEEYQKLISQAKALGMVLIDTKTSENMITRVYRKDKDYVIEFSNKGIKTYTGFQTAFYIQVFDAFDYSLISSSDQ